MPRQDRVPEYSDEEKNAIVDYLLALKASKIRDFLEQHELKKSGTKGELRERVQEVLDSLELTYVNLVRCIDRVEPWGKQHVFLYNAPEGKIVDNWRNPQWVEQHLKQHGIRDYLNVHLPLILPEALSLSIIKYSDELLKIVAVEKRDYWERSPEQDERRRTDAGEDVELRAFVHHVKRAAIVLEEDGRVPGDPNGRAS